MQDLDPISHEMDQIARSVVDAAFEVHMTLGPGLLESIYEKCLQRELIGRGLRPRSQVSFNVSYKGEMFDSGFRADLIVNETVLIEVKSVEALLPVHTAQVLTYLKLTGLRIGLLVNFNVPLIKNGIRRLVR